MVATRFTETFGCRHPLQQAGIGGVATPDLAIAVARAGGLGMLTGTVGHEALAAQLDGLPADGSIGVNFLVPFLDRTALDDASNRSPYVELFWGAPDADVIETVHAGGARAGWQVGSADEARAARDTGCDVIVAQGIEAGRALGEDQSWAPDWPTSTSVGAVEARALYAGQSVGAVRSRQPAAEIVAELVEKAERVLARTS